MNLDYAHLLWPINGIAAMAILGYVGYHLFTARRWVLGSLVALVILPVTFRGSFLPGSGSALDSDQHLFVTMFNAQVQAYERMGAGWYWAIWAVVVAVGLAGRYWLNRKRLDSNP
jgi:hypothetical protein